MMKLFLVLYVAGQIAAVDPHPFLNDEVGEVECMVVKAETLMYIDKVFKNGINRDGSELTDEQATIKVVCELHEKMPRVIWRTT